MRDYEPYYTQDGSIGLYSYKDKDVYHSKYGALTEAWEKFVIPAGIDSTLETNKTLKVLDICYGVGYNTKALMSYIIDKNFFKIKNRNFIQKITNIVSVRTNNTLHKIASNKSSIDTKYTDNPLPIIHIDCLESNEDLVKISPFLKTIKTPEEIFSIFVPEIFNCFDVYYAIKNIFCKFASIFYPKNNKEIKELLDIKYQNMHIDKEYKIHNYVNYIIANYLSDYFRSSYITKETIKNWKDKKTSKYLKQKMIEYAKFNQFWGYNLSSEPILSRFLHNIYYRNLSMRNKNINFKAAQSLFKLNYYIKDARKSILELNNEYDCIFLDAFTYTKAPMLWSFEFIGELYKKLSPSGVLLTYSNSAQIRNTLLENNFYVGKIYNEKNGKFNGTIASKDKAKIMYPLNNYELGLCATKAGIPYHDPNLSFSDKDIMELREYEFKHSNLMSSSKYMKIRSIRGENDTI